VITRTNSNEIIGQNLLFRLFFVKLSGYEKSGNQVYWGLKTFVGVTGINGKEQDKQVGVMVGR